MSRYAAAAAVIALSETIRCSQWRAPLTLRVDAQAPPSALAALIRDVEREPELVPGVRRVIVLARGAAALPGGAGGRPVQPLRGYPSCGRDARAPRHVLAWLERFPQTTSGEETPAISGWVRYEVQGVTAGIPWTVRFCKIWEDDTRFVWWSEGGTGRPEHCGCLRLQPNETDTSMELRTATRSGLPLLGGAATLLVNPLFLAPAFTAWLRNLARAAERG
jgi:hypothetical protein